MARSDKTHLMVHCSATHPDWMNGQPLKAKVAEIKRWHVEDNGWKDIGYAYVIDRDGRVLTGRDLDKDGDVIEETAAAAKGWNTNAVHVCLLGGAGSSADDDFTDHFTEAQNAALRALIDNVQNDLGRKLKLIGHNETAAKACPGFQVRQWYDKKPPKSVATSTTVGASGVGATAAVTSGAAAVSQLDGTAQIVVAIGVFITVMAFAWIFRERLKKWARGIK